MFVNNLVVSRITAEQRWLLRNDSFTHFELQQGRWQQHQQAIRSVDHLHCLLSNQLQVNISLADSQLLFQRFVNKVEAIKKPRIMRGLIHLSNHLSQHVLQDPTVLVVIPLFGGVDTYIGFKLSFITLFIRGNDNKLIGFVE